MDSGKLRVYIPYTQYIGVLEKLSDDTAKELMIKIAEDCMSMLNLDRMAQDHNNRYNNKSIRVDKDGAVESIRNSKSKVEAMIQLAFWVNKCTKSNNLKEKELTTEDEMNKFLGDLKSKKLGDQRRAVSKGMDLIRQGRMSELYGYLEEGSTREHFDSFHDKLHSKDERQRKQAIRRIGKLKEASFKNYYEKAEYDNREQIYYEIKHLLVTAIIKELGLHPDKYKDYLYGFIRDNDAYVLAINVPEHLGTYQFHILPDYEKRILFDIDCLEVQHEFEQLAQGNTTLGQMSFVVRKDDIQNVDSIEKDLKDLKRKVKDKDSISNPDVEQDFRKIFLYSVLLGKDAREELYDANPQVAFDFINERNCGLESYVRELTAESRNEYNMILAHLKKFKKVYVGQFHSLDSKVAVEALKRKCREIGFELPEENIIPFNDKDQYKPEFRKAQGLFININKNGNDFSYHNRIMINPDESKRETSVSGYLYKLGFDVPKDIVMYVNRPEFADDEVNKAYSIASIGLTGEQIYSLCEELNSQGTDLGHAVLTDEQVEKYNARECVERLKKRAHNIAQSTNLIKVGNSTVAISDSKDRRAPQWAYKHGADYVISVNEYSKDDNTGVTFSINSNPSTRDLPSEVMRWSYQLLSDELTKHGNDSALKGVNDMLIQPTRVVLGGKRRKDVYLKDRRQDKSKSFKEEITDEIMTLIGRAEMRELGFDFLEESSKIVDAQSMIDALNKKVKESETR